MTLHYQLLTKPSREKSSALQPELAQMLLDQGVLTAAHFVESEDTTPNTPAWLYFLQNGGNSTAASDIVFEQLRALNFDWNTPVEDIGHYSRPPETKTAFEAAFPYCSANTAEKILNSLSSQDKTALQTNALLPHRVSLINALNYNRPDLARVLLAHGWDLEQMDDTGASNLLRAPSWSVAQGLLECGANVVSSDNNQGTVWDRVQKWTSYNLSASTIITEIKKHIKNTAKDTPISAKKRKKNEVIDSMFHVIAEQKYGNLSRRWSSLQSHDKENDQLVDNAGRSFVRALCEKAMGYDTQQLSKENKDNIEFFTRVTAFLHQVDSPNGWLDLGKPLEGFDGWTEHDHLYMTLLMLHRNADLKIKHVETFSRHFQDWQTTRLEILAVDVDRWYQTFDRLPKTHSESRLRDLINLEVTAQSPWVRLQNALLKVPSDNPWYQRVAAPLEAAVQEAKNHNSIGSLPAYHGAWLGTWALRKKIPLDHPVWTLLTAAALQAMTYEMLYNRRSWQTMLAWNKHEYVRTVVQNNLHTVPHHAFLLQAWINDLTKETSSVNHEGKTVTKPSTFDTYKERLNDETLAFFNKIFLNTALESMEATSVARRKL